ncbi:hypothetical protein CVT24_000814 [Panaeolus cyanescens]|uniref:G domain-containing protein n=1 Tax=Panaeolus cyanescens TaxID=181874 RepID=A0A409YCT6_9AGAR|nr:hypothetical protein CVT24_000814 [Panaeolus cyanescens]
MRERGWSRTPRRHGIRAFNLPRCDSSVLSDVFYSGPNLYLRLVGPTGAGKSSFIEALANDRELGLSKDQLESVTQTVSAHEIVNVRFWGKRIFLLDCPGFSDNSLSEFEIVDMVNKWMDANGIPSLNIILYFCPITDTRLPGTKRKTMEMLKALVKSSPGLKPPNGRYNEGTVTIVTTMWDQEMIVKGAGITKFKNTQKSALEIIDIAVANGWGSNDYAYTSRQVSSGIQLKETEHGAFLREDLISRIEAAQQRQLILQADSQASLDNPALTSLLEKEQKHTEYLLEKYEQQLKLFENPPAPDSSDGETSFIDPTQHSTGAYDKTAIGGELGDSTTSGRKLRGWIKDPLCRFKGMFGRKHASRDETVG